ncbi:MAG: ferrous iron transport protein A [Sphingobacteriales bacterium]|jgi:Fe2+ transport system protein FeoA|nr:ferrous iron transport protein A [Sphingobacteriales bacterium]MBP9141985.1 ferrous iron transport protein A [Chitinophagales bacterium]MDA0198959.1 FeoA family protein [Bacteroidota bacterium]MBK6888918.1 ferrous iron transport protein A [Sphingobacteriales bacterium]MBK7528579.1 ferrous iron transport protein A [Sphingobacteriales bacterium]
MPSPKIQPIPLTQLRLGQTAILFAVNHPELKNALLNMGVQCGDTIKLSNIALWGCPIAIAVNGTKIGIRKHAAKQIWVELTDN